MKIVTGFQTGVDIAAARAAKAAGLATGGAMPKRFLTLDGPHPEYAAMYGAFELPSANWNIRTRRNVRDTEATFLFVTDADSRGTYCAVNACQRLARPCYTILLAFLIPDGLPIMTMNGVEVSCADLATLMRPYASVNIGGNRYEWLEEKMEMVLLQIFDAIISDGCGNIYSVPRHCTCPDTSIAPITVQDHINNCDSDP